MLEPLFLKPVFQEKIWGGTKLKSVFDLYKGYRRFGLEMDDEFSRFYPEFILEINIKN